MKHLLHFVHDADSVFIQLNKTHFLLLKISSYEKDRLINHQNKDDKSYGNR